MIPESSDTHPGAMHTMKFITRTALTLAFFAGGASLGLADGRNPASLLVYPEFQRGNGTETVWTVTNTGGEFVRIHAFYVRGDEDPSSQHCTVNNVFVTLAPKDTFTAFASGHLSGTAATEGYIYLFAESPSPQQANWAAPGTPVSYNHLIGELLVLDADEEEEYSMGAFGFRAIPTVDGTATKVGTTSSTSIIDGDNWRDLNGIEYERAPDKILIPRFMGQEADYESELIFINLSGGRQFTTMVDFLVFNDNSEAFSAQFVFSCWAKEDLEDINGLFSTTFLQSTNDNPSEIRDEAGMPSGKEAGWMTIDGNIAWSNTSDIPNPAILAVLVECTDDDDPCTAELPFFLGTQIGGDLLPTVSSWDGD